MRITWHGHSCFEISGSINLVVDPHDGTSIGLRRPDTTADVVAITHDHFDHNKAEIVSKPETRVVKGKEKVKFPGITIQGYEVFHDEKKGRVRGEVTMFKFTMEDITGLHAGDLGHVLDKELIERIGKMDILFVPVGGRFTIDSEKAVEVMKQLNPTVTIPMHYRLPGTTLLIEGVAPFLKKAGLPVLRVGNAIDFLSEDLPDDQEIWVFDY